MCKYVQKFADKTFAEGGYVAKFAKVFTRESFQLYGKQRPWWSHSGNVEFVLSEQLL